MAQTVVSLAVDHELTAYKDGLDQLRVYLRSAKFSVDPTVQTADVLLWLDQIRSRALDDRFAVE